MDIIIPKRNLLPLLARSVTVADKKSAMPALANVLLSADAGTLCVSATDLYLSVTGDTPAEVSIAGAVALPAKDLFERVKMMPDGPIQIIANDTAQTTIKAVGSARRYTLHGIPGSEFPVLPKPTPDAPTLTLPVDVLALLIARTHFSISTDETRPHVNSGLFEWSGDKVRLVSTDGHRLSKMEATVSGSSATATMLIPLKAIGELRRLADEAKGEKEALTVSITQSGPNAFFAIAGMTFSCKLVDAQFPPYQQVIPEPRVAARAPRAALIEALRAMKVASPDRTGGVKLTFEPGVLRLTSESPESGNGMDEIAIDYAGPAATIGFNAEYLLDALGVVATDDVLLDVGGELDPMRITAGDGSDEYVGVVMPQRIA